MNTQAHALFSYILLRKKDRRDLSFPIFMGAILPDLPMFVFYFYEKVLRGQPEERIWGELYFDPGWQAAIDAFNSIPIAVALALVALGLKKPMILAFSLSLLLHAAFDLPLHHEDAHRHFFPFSDYRFESPVSYWDPKHYGHVFSAMEAILYFIGGLYVWKRLQSKLARFGVIFGGVAYIAVYGYFAVFL